MKIYIGNETGNYYWLENGILLCCPMGNQEKDEVLEVGCGGCEVDFDNISKEEQEKLEYERRQKQREARLERLKKAGDKKT